MSSDSRLFVFGPGEVYTELLTYYDGTTPTVVQPFKMDVQQGMTLDFSTTPKELWSQSTYATAIGLGEGKVTGKIKQGRIDSRMVEAMFAGQAGAPTTGMNLTYPNDFSATIPATPFQITITPPGSGTWVRDWGVRYASSGLFLNKTASAPPAGSYSVSGSGVYLFNTADVGSVVLIDYEYSLTTGFTIAYNNPLQGQVPFSHLRYQGSYGGRYLGVDLPLIVPNKMTIDSKQKDWMMPEFDFQVFAGPSQLVASLFFTE